MGDIAALKILNSQIDTFKKLPAPPDLDKEFESYKANIDQIVDKATKTVEEVSGYGDKILKKLADLKQCIPDQITRMQKAIQNQLERLVEIVHTTEGNMTLFGPNSHPLKEVQPNGTRPTGNLELLKRAHELELMSKALMESRLNELIREAGKVYARVQDDGYLTANEIERLKGCLNSWTTAKNESYEKEKRRLEEEEERKRKREEERMRREAKERKIKEEEERRRREEGERKRKEEEERVRREEERRRRQEEEERLKREEEERLKKEEEERVKREEERRRRQEEEERLKREEEERLKREEEERIAREAEEKRQREVDERKRREEEKRRREEAERQRKEAERREQERLQREEEERTIRLDPNNWDAHVYERTITDEVTGRKPYHGGVCCMVASPPGDIEREELECNASDELDDVIDILDDGEKPASSVISVQSKKGNLKSEVPSRVFIPHCQTPTSSEELVVKLCVNGSDWVTSGVVMPTQKIAEKEKGVSLSNLVGLEVNDFENIKVMVVARPKSQTVIVDKPGLNFNSITDKNVRLFIPRDTFGYRTAVRLVVQPIPQEVIASNAKDGDGLWESIMSTSSMITISCEKSPVKDIEVDIARNTPSSGMLKSPRGKLYHLYANKDRVWKFADVEYKGQNNVVSVTLPAYKTKYNLFELELNANIQKEKALKVARKFHYHMFKTSVQIIVKQRDDKPNEAVMMLTRSKIASTYLEMLKDEGYGSGPDISREFALRDGQKLFLTCGGNIDISTGKHGKMKFTYFTYMNPVKQELMLHVKDMYKQKDLPEYVGAIKLTVDNGIENPEELFELTVALPKPERQKISVNVKKIRFPYYLSALAGFLSTALCDANDIDWKAVIGDVTGQNEFRSGYRKAKRKVDEDDQRAMCRTILCDWMKATPRQDDKVGPILDVIRRHRLYELVEKCQHFVDYQKDQLTDKVLEDIAGSTSRDFDELAVVLGLDTETVENCKKERVRTTKDKLLLLLVEWRESDEVVRNGDKALDVLKSICSV